MAGSGHSLRVGKTERQSIKWSRFGTAERAAKLKVAILMNACIASCTVPWGRSYTDAMEGDRRHSSSLQWLGPGELARRLGISIKALRVYERAGLVAPGRREGGWRTYGPRDIARLHEVLALKNLGLSLGEVKRLLEAPSSSLRQTLEIQQMHLVAQIGAAQRRLAAVNAARRRLGEEGSLDIDQLLELASETAVAPPVSADQVEAIIHGLAKSHDAEGHLQHFEQDLKARLEKSGLSHSEFERELSQLIADASMAAQAGDPRSGRGRELADRWRCHTAVLGPAFGEELESRGTAVATFARALIGDSELAAALAFLRGAVAAHPAPAADTDETD